MKTVSVLSILLTALALSAGLAHLYALPNKIDLPRADYLVAQQVYRGWALIGIAVIGALICTLVLAFLVRHWRDRFAFTATAAICILLSLVIFFLFTFPANQETQNWTVLPENWQELRAQWEYSHAVGAILYLVALTCLTISLLVDSSDDRDRSGPPSTSEFQRQGIR